jgi:hypothetical protein
MGYIEQFSEKMVEKSVAKDYEHAIGEWQYRGGEFNKDGFCTCGHPIVKNLVVHNSLNRNTMVVGNCCIKKFGITRNHFNRSPRNFLEYALTRVHSDDQGRFLDTLVKSLAIYGCLRLSKKQLEWLEKIAGEKYRWQWRW